MIEITKILTVLYKDNISLPLNNGTNHYYPCATISSSVTVDCCMFSIHAYAFERSLFYNTCKDKLKKDKRKRMRVVEYPSRNRPYATLTYIGKAKAFAKWGRTVRVSKQNILG